MNHARGRTPAGAPFHRPSKLSAGGPAGLSRDALDRVVAALREIGRPITRAELTSYGRAMPKLAAAELEELLEQLERWRVVRSFERREPYRCGAAAMVVRRYWEAVDRSRGD